MKGAQRRRIDRARRDRRAAKFRWSDSICSPPSAASCCRRRSGAALPRSRTSSAIKIAPFNRYRTLDVVRGVVEAGAADRVTLYTGNDDHIIHDLVTPYAVPAQRTASPPSASRAGCSDTGASGSSSAVELLEQASRRGRQCRAGRSAGARFAGDGLQCRDLRRRQQLSRRHRRLPRNPAPPGIAARASGASIRRKRSAPARKKRSTASVPPIRISTTMRSCAKSRAMAGMMRPVNWPLPRRCRTMRGSTRVRRADRGRKSRSAAALLPGGGQPSAAGGGVAFLRRARQRAEIRAALAVRHGPARCSFPTIAGSKTSPSPAPRFSAAIFSRSSSGSASRCCFPGSAGWKCS